ncbi:hypothetical protein LCL95_09640 [Bacillus timonensis]|nr:hypothetical protein [Bacillus timonensis]
MNINISILNLIIILYIVFSLSTIKHQLKLITKHLNVKEEQEKVSNAEIEKQLEDELNR